MPFLAVVPYFLLYHAERLAGADPTALELTWINIWVLNLWISVFWYRSSRRLFLALAMSNIALYTLAISAMSAYQGGMTTSMRYLIIALPSFCVLLPDLRVFAYRKTLLVLFAVSAANAFVLAATSTMYLSEYPLSQHAYPDFLKGRLGFNPLLAAFGVNGTTAGFVVAAPYAFVLASLVRTLLAGARRGAERVRS